MMAALKVRPTDCSATGHYARSVSAKRRFGRCQECGNLCNVSLPSDMDLCMGLDETKKKLRDLNYKLQAILFNYCPNNKIVFLEPITACLQTR